MHVDKLMETVCEWTVDYHIRQLSLTAAAVPSLWNPFWVRGHMLLCKRKATILKRKKRKKAFFFRLLEMQWFLFLSIMKKCEELKD